MPELAVRVAVVRATLRLESWTCHSPTKWALAVAEGTTEPLGLEEFPGPELAVPVAAVVEDAPVLELFFEHPPTAIVTIIVAAMTSTAPDLPRRRNEAPSSDIDVVMDRRYGSARCLASNTAKRGPRSAGGAVAPSTSCRA
jgi:hypothetical protein